MVESSKKSSYMDTYLQSKWLKMLFSTRSITPPQLSCVRFDLLFYCCCQWKWGDTVGVREDRVSLHSSSRVTEEFLCASTWSPWCFVMMLCWRDKISAGNYPAHLQFIIWAAVEMFLTVEFEFKQMSNWIAEFVLLIISPPAGRQSRASPLSIPFTPRFSYLTDDPPNTSFRLCVGLWIESMC